MGCVIGWQHRKKKLMNYMTLSQTLDSDQLILLRDVFALYNFSIKSILWTVSWIV